MRIISKNNSKDPNYDYDSYVSKFKDKAIEIREEITGIIGDSECRVTVCIYLELLVQGSSEPKLLRVAKSDILLNSYNPVSVCLNDYPDIKEIHDGKMAFIIMDDIAKYDLVRFNKDRNYRPSKNHETASYNSYYSCLIAPIISYAKEPPNIKGYLRMYTTKKLSRINNSEQTIEMLKQYFIKKAQELYLSA